MKFWVGVTDNDWFRLCRERHADEINFWQPSPDVGFRALEPGGLFLFKLHSPQNFIVGGGFFVRFVPLPVSLAWDAFREKNGVESQAELLSRIRRYRHGDVGANPMIGCVILAEPFYLPENQRIPVPASWGKNIVRGKTYDSKEPEGAALYGQVRAYLLTAQGFHGDTPVLERDERERYGAAYLTRARLGQGTFRVLVTDAYQRRCAITGERTLPALEAAHIKPYASAGPHQVSNGLLLRSDWHRLYDEGYITITPDLHVEVSKRIHEEFENGHDYYAHHGAELKVIPGEAWERPSRAFLNWHNENVYKS